MDTIKKLLKHIIITDTEFLSKDIYDVFVEYVNSFDDLTILSHDEIWMLSMLTYNCLYNKSHPRLEHLCFHPIPVKLVNITNLEEKCKNHFTKFQNNKDLRKCVFSESSKSYFTSPQEWNSQTKKQYDIPTNKINPSSVLLRDIYARSKSKRQCTKEKIQTPKIKNYEVSPIHPKVKFNLNNLIQYNVRDSESIQIDQFNKIEKHKFKKRDIKLVTL